MSKRVDLTGRQFGKLTVVGLGDEYVSPTGVRLFRWKCCCECGKEVNVTTSQLKRGKSSCGCLLTKEDLSGKRFGYLVVISSAVEYVSPEGNKKSRWLCKCDCGNEINVLGMSLKNGDCKSCGCHGKGAQKSRIDIDSLIGLKLLNATIIGIKKRSTNLSKLKLVCECNCGRNFEACYISIRRNPSISCGCQRKKNEKKVVTQSIVGKIFGKLTVLEELPPHITPNGSKQRIVRCRCNCGKEVVERLSAAQKVKQCRKCSGKERRLDITGQRFGKLIVLSMAEDYVSPAGYHLARCNCRCDCGKKCVVNMSQLKRGQKSCGCENNPRGLLKDVPSLVAKYDYDRNNEAGVIFDTLTARSNQKVWWNCKKCGNSWFATIASQNDKIKHGCPFCSGRYVIKGQTDLESQHPEVLKEWDFDKNVVKPSEVSCFSTRKVCWKCSECGNSWSATVANRISCHSGCPKCNIEGVNSFCEQALFFYVKKVYADAINGDNHIGMELDVYIPSIGKAIEYDGEVWHRKKKKIMIDEKKNQLCKDNGIELIRIREPHLQEMDGCKVFVRDDSTTDASLGKVIQETLLYLSGTVLDVDVTRDMPLILEQFATKKFENSLLYNYPNVATEWHPTKNGLLTPDRVNKGSRYKVWWLGKCGHEWQMAVNNRTLTFVRADGRVRKSYGCPFCSGRRHFPVKCIETNQVFYNIDEALSFAGLHRAHDIYRCCRGVRNSAGGYRWEYVISEE